jgi:hypothetical protein
LSRRSLLPSAGLLATVLSLLSLSCSDAFQRGSQVARIAFEPRFSQRDGEILRSLRQFNLGVTSLHVTLRRPGSDVIVAEKSVEVGETQTEVTVEMDVAIIGAEEPFEAALAMFSGDVLIFSGTIRVIAKAGADPTVSRPQLQLVWVGPGNTATRVEIDQPDRTLAAINGRLALSATAFDAAGAVVADPDFLARFRWTSVDTSLGTIPATGGEFVTRGVAGVARVAVLTPNLLRDTVALTLQTVQPVAVVSFTRKVEVLDRGATAAPVPVSATDANGTPVSTATYTYASRNTQVATVGTNGAISGVARGQTVIVVTASEPGSTGIIQDSLLAVVAEPGAPVLISSIDRFSYGRNADVTVSVFVDMRSQTARLGSATLDVDWNPAQLDYQSHVNGGSGVSPTVNATTESTGRLTLAMADVTGFTGRVELLRITFRTSAAASAGALTLAAREISAADFTNLLGVTAQVSHPIVVP